MNDRRESYDQSALAKLPDFAPEFSEIEIGCLTDDEYELASLRHELMLVREREEMEQLERELDEELSHLFSLTIFDGTDHKQPDPPGWPGV